MDQFSHYLMWMNSKHHHILNSPHFDQEQAFAEDAHGPLGGFVWPPRCYSCTFCKREFRSAQALGGHMNVHRRDRARLKQSLCPQTEETIHNELFPSHEVICNSKYSNPSNIFVASPPSEKFFSKQTNVPLFSSPIIRSQAQQKELSHVTCKSNMRKEEFTFEGHVDGYVETNLSVGLNSGVSSRTRPAGDIGGDFKRQKTDYDVSPLPFMFKGCSNDEDNIDLELRLGDSPTVK